VFAYSLLLLWLGMDALSEELKDLKLDSAFFYNGGSFPPRGFFVRLICASWRPTSINPPDACLFTTCR
jgi:hypothetical protein